MLTPDYDTIVLCCWCRWLICTDTSPPVPGLCRLSPPELGDKLLWRTGEIESEKYKTSQSSHEAFAVHRFDAYIDISWYILYINIDNVLIDHICSVTDRNRNEDRWRFILRLPRVLLLLLHAGDWIGQCYVSSGGNILELSTGLREIAVSGKVLLLIESIH